MVPPPMAFFSGGSMRAPREDSIDAGEFRKRYPQPIVLGFQPTRFEIAESPEALKEYESNLTQMVGLRVDGIADLIHATGTCTTSCCPDCDDCDMD